MDILEHWLIDEKQAMLKLVEKAKVSDAQQTKIQEQAHKLVTQVRKNRLKK